ncbi:hypothetical protein GOODEAATRI_020592 [Goodea atripinnis]|uniref:Uncharacterized protein n=1 Tax=Goodea atripinnis TaxID=208336 RepID=A0ABV0Q0B2_9TELE
MFRCSTVHAGKVKPSDTHSPMRHMQLLRDAPHFQICMFIVHGASVSQKPYPRSQKEVYVVSWVMKSAQPVKQVEIQLRWKHKNDKSGNLFFHANKMQLRGG